MLACIEFTIRFARCQRIIAFMSGANDLSGFVANELSGFILSFEGTQGDGYETDKIATGAFNEGE